MNFARSKTEAKISDTKSEGNFNKTYQFEKSVNKFGNKNNITTLT